MVVVVVRSSEGVEKETGERKRERERRQGLGFGGCACNIKGENLISNFFFSMWEAAEGEVK